MSLPPKLGGHLITTYAVLNVCSAPVDQVVVGSTPIAHPSKTHGLMPVRVLRRSPGGEWLYTTRIVRIHKCL